MKYIKILLLLLVGIFLYACSEVVDLETVLNKVIEELPYELNDDLTIITKYKYQNYDHPVEFKSDDSNILSNKGEITKGLFDQEVSGTITVYYKEQSKSKKVDFLVTKYTESELKNILLDELDLVSSTSADLNLPKQFALANHVLTLNWVSENPEVITNDGRVTVTDEIQTVSFTLNLVYEDLAYTYNEFYTLTIEALSADEILNSVANGFKFPSITEADLNLPSKIGVVSVVWTPSDSSIISSSGTFFKPNFDTTVNFEAIFVYSGKVVTKNYTTLAVGYTKEFKFEQAINSISFPELIIKNLTLPTSFEYGVTGSWKSNSPGVITNSGEITLTQEQQQFSITLTLQAGEETMEKEYVLMTGTIEEGEVQVGLHHYLGYATEFDQSEFNNVELEGDRLVLSAGKTTGSYESPVFKTLNEFTILVASWAAITSMTATAEIQVRVRVEGVWSSYLSYGKFGLGLQNKMLNQNGGVAKLSTDEVYINNSKKGEAFQYKVILNRNTTGSESPKLSLVSMALTIPDYTYNVDISDLPNKVEYKLTKLYQYDVPSIGGHICSPTSSAMLLMNKGHTFTDQYPHRETAVLFMDYGNKIYGNWVYNTVGMSAYGENSYVKKIYSIEELFHHLATVGPVALSIKGNTGRYTTNGHLIVVSGYEITPTGRKILVHDPALPEVEFFYSEAIFDIVTRNVIYVVE